MDTVESLFTLRQTRFKKHSSSHSLDSGSLLAYVIGNFR